MSAIEKDFTILPIAIIAENTNALKNKTLIEMGFSIERSQNNSMCCL